MQPRASAPSFSNSIYFPHTDKFLIATVDHKQSRHSTVHFVFEFAPDAFELFDQPQSAEQKKEIANIILAAFLTNRKAHDKARCYRIAGIQLINNQYQFLITDDTSIETLHCSLQATLNADFDINWKYKDVNEVRAFNMQSQLSLMVNNVITQKSRKFLNQKKSTIINFNAAAMPLPSNKLSSIEIEKLSKEFIDEAMQTFAYGKLQELKKPADKLLLEFDQKLEEHSHHLNGFYTATDSLVKNVIQAFRKEKPNFDNINLVKDDLIKKIVAEDLKFSEFYSQLFYIKKCLAWMLYNAAGHYYEKLQENYSSTPEEKAEHIRSFNAIFFKDIAEITLSGTLLLNPVLLQNFKKNKFETILTFINGVITRCQTSKKVACDKEKCLRRAFESLPKDVKKLLSIETKTLGKESLVDINLNAEFNKLQQRINQEQKDSIQKVEEIVNEAVSAANEIESNIKVERDKFTKNNFSVVVTSVEKSLSNHHECDLNLELLKNRIQQNVRYCRQLNDFGFVQFTNQISAFDGKLKRFNHQHEKLQTKLDNLRKQLDAAKNDFIQYERKFSEIASNINGKINVQDQLATDFSGALQEAKQLNDRQKLAETKKPIRDQYRLLAEEYASVMENRSKHAKFEKYSRNYTEAWKDFHKAYVAFDDDQVTKILDVAREEKSKLDKLAAIVSENKLRLNDHLKVKIINPQEYSGWMLQSIEEIINSINDECRRQEDKKNEFDDRSPAMSLLSQRLVALQTLTEDINDQKNALTKKCITELDCKSKIINILNRNIKDTQSPLRENLKYAPVLNFFGHKTDTVKNLKKIQQNFEKLGNTKSR